MVDGGGLAAAAGVPRAEAVPPATGHQQQADCVPEGAEGEVPLAGAAEAGLR